MAVYRPCQTAVTGVMADPLWSVDVKPIVSSWSAIAEGYVWLNTYTELSLSQRITSSFHYYGSVRWHLGADSTGVVGSVESAL
jgi:hypothetical protein